MTNALEVTLPDSAPFIDYTREFDYPAARVFGAHVDPDTYAEWIGPDRLDTRIDVFDAVPGGSYRFVQTEGTEEYAFRGVFHSIRPAEFILQTFEYEGFPDQASLDFLRFEDLPDGRSRLVGHSVYPSLETRDSFVSSGMESGMAAGYDKLEQLLAFATA
ncbi:MULTISPECIES: SRPBCC family protein [Arthrobacter]|uniref:SRPBCC family protein n=1 Tax=Arthrobacter TaxID=1663 RepID=UPI001D15BAE0|nr:MULTISPECIES: SRPBCC family protein [Arthrobacter]MCC3282045.1 SRPBCC family protein [Arthrobacter caoxuetaonis]MCC9194468.1 SRPBCC family protein [Arthrobacter sp. zg-Y916]